MDWIFQGNPKVYRVLEDLRTGVPIGSWSVTHSLDQLQEGDGAALWISGPSAGVYALGEVTGFPLEETTNEGWIDPDDRGILKWFCPLSLDDVFYETPIPKSELRVDPRFQNASILKHPWAGNPFPLTDLEWKAIKDHRTGRRPRAAKPAAVRPQQKRRLNRRSKTQEWHPHLVPPSVKQEVWDRDRGRCVICKSKVNLQFDHVIPWSKGGSSITAANIQILCAKHNLTKSAKIE